MKLSSSAAIVGLAGCSGGGGEGATGDESVAGESTEGMMAAATTFTVRIENVAPTDFYGSETSTGGAIWITPGAYAVHTGENPVFTAGESASIGLEALAERVRGGDGARERTRIRRRRRPCRRVHAREHRRGPERPDRRGARRAADQAPAQDSPEQGADEDGVVALLANVDDGYDYPDATDVIQVTVTPQ